VPSDRRLGILLLSGSHERAHYAFVLASGAAALGRDVVLFATNHGCHALLADWSGLGMRRATRGCGPMASPASPNCARPRSNSAQG
jgi:peroxiredoxin family protein